MLPILKQQWYPTSRERLEFDVMTNELSELHGHEVEVWHYNHKVGVDGGAHVARVGKLPTEHAVEPGLRQTWGKRSTLCVSC